MNTQTLENILDEDVTDSRDIIARIDELEEQIEETEDGLPSEEVTELALLKQFEQAFEDSPDWEHGESIIADSYFQEYTQQLIDDCFEIPKEMTSGEWPYRHYTLDLEAASKELQTDYIQADIQGKTFWIRA